MWETQVQSLGWEDPLEKEMATHSSIIAWEIPRTEESGMLQIMESQRDKTEHTCTLPAIVELHAAVRTNIGRSYVATKQQQKCTHYPVSPNGNILQKNGTISPAG